MRRPAGGRPAEGDLSRIGSALVAVLLLAGCSAAAPRPAADPIPTPTPTSVSLAGPAPLTDAQVSVVRVAIPAIGVDAAPVESLGLLPDGSLAAPADFDRVGWFAAGTVPGERGPAVVAGHVDSVAGPAVFYRLGDLAPGDDVQIDLSDGRTLTFRVTGSLQARKDDFPTEEVYGPTPDAELRLITCSGAFDRSVRSYVDNTVVFATLV